MPLKYAANKRSAGRLSPEQKSFSTEEKTLSLYWAVCTSQVCSDVFIVQASVSMDKSILNTNMLLAFAWLFVHLECSF